MIRPATVDDFDTLKTLFQEAYDGASQVSGEIDWEHGRRMLAYGVTFPNFHCEVVEHNGEVVGVMGGMINKNIWGAATAMDLITYSKRETPGLIRRFIQWAESQNADFIHITSLANNPRYSKLIKRLGFAQTGVNFIKVN